MGYTSTSEMSHFAWQWLTLKWIMNSQSNYLLNDNNIQISPYLSYNDGLDMLSHSNFTEKIETLHFAH